MALPSAVPATPFAGALSGASRRLLRLGALVAAAVLVVVTIEGWLPRAHTGTTATGATPVPRPLNAGVRQARAAGIDVDGAVAVASHTPMAVPDQPGELAIEDPAYRAT